MLSENRFYSPFARLASKYAVLRGQLSAKILTKLEYEGNLGHVVYQSSITIRNVVQIVSNRNVFVELYAKTKVETEEMLFIITGMCLEKRLIINVEVFIIIVFLVPKRVAKFQAGIASNGFVGRCISLSTQRSDVNQANVSWTFEISHKGHTNDVPTYILIEVFS